MAGYCSRMNSKLPLMFLQDVRFLRIRSSTSLHLGRIVVIGRSITLILIMINLIICPARTMGRPRSILATSVDSAAQNISQETLHDFEAWVAYVSSKHPSSTSTSSESMLESSATLTVSKSAGDDAQFSSIQDAIDSIPSGNTQRITVQIAAGTYEEKVTIPRSKPYITFVGAGRDLTTITWDDTASSTGTTFNSASVAINSDYFIAHDISFKNSAPSPTPGAVGKQAVALRISGDKASFYKCGFYGAQDTLYDDTGRHYFENCYIEGSIDFIFGDGLSYYTGCELHSIATSSGALTAQDRGKPSEDTGFSFVNCKITGCGMIFLGRAWGSYSRVVFLYTYIDDIIIPSGWNDFGNSNNQKTAFYGEYQCSGPGANSKSLVAWSYQLSDSQAAPFASVSFVDGESWIPS